MPDLCIETMDISGEFQILVVTKWNYSAEGHSRKYIIVGEWTRIIQHLPHTELHTKAYCYKQEVGYCPHCAESWQGKSPSAYISAIYSKLAV